MIFLVQSQEHSLSVPSDKDTLSKQALEGKQRTLWAWPPNLLLLDVRYPLHKWGGDPGQRDLSAFTCFSNLILES